MDCISVPHCTPRRVKIKSTIFVYFAPSESIERRSWCVRHVLILLWNIFFGLSLLKLGRNSVHRRLNTRLSFCYLCKLRTVKFHGHCYVGQQSDSCTWFQNKGKAGYWLASLIGEGKAWNNPNSGWGFVSRPHEIFLLARHSSQFFQQRDAVSHGTF